MRLVRLALGASDNGVVDTGGNIKKELTVITSVPLPPKDALFRADRIIFRAKELPLEKAVAELKSLIEIQGLKKVYFNHQDVVALSEKELQTEPFEKMKIGWHFQGSLLQHPVLQTSFWRERMLQDGYGTSVHSLLEVSSLADLVNRIQVPPDHLLVSNVFKTACKAGKPPVDRDELQAILRALKSQFGEHQTRILLLGGINEINVHQLKSYDHQGVAVMSLAQTPKRLKKLKDLL